MSVSIKLPRKGLQLAHINICSFRNKLVEISDVLTTNKIHVLAVTETFSDDVVNINGYNIYRKDRNKYGGGVAIYIQVIFLYN